MEAHAPPPWIPIPISHPTQQSIIMLHQQAQHLIKAVYWDTLQALLKTAGGPQPIPTLNPNLFLKTHQPTTPITPPNNKTPPTYAQVTRQHTPPVLHPHPTTSQSNTPLRQGARSPSPTPLHQPVRKAPTTPPATPKNTPPSPQTPTILPTTQPTPSPQPTPSSPKKKSKQRSTSSSPDFDIRKLPPRLLEEILTTSEPTSEDELVAANMEKQDLELNELIKEDIIRRNAVNHPQLYARYKVLSSRSMVYYDSVRRLLNKEQKKRYRPLNDEESAELEGLVDKFEPDLDDYDLEDYSFYDGSDPEGWSSSDSSDT